MNEPYHFHPIHEVPYSMPHEEPKKLFSLKIVIPIYTLRDENNASVRMTRQLGGKVVQVKFTLNYHPVPNNEKSFKFYCFIIDDIPKEDLALIQFKAKYGGVPNSENCELPNYPVFDHKTPHIQYLFEGDIKCGETHRTSELHPRLAGDNHETEKKLISIEEIKIEFNDSCTIPPEGGNQ